MNDCLTQDQLYTYNTQRGLYNYIDPFAKLTCVKVSNAPEIGKYYLENSDITTNKEE